MSEQRGGTIAAFLAVGVVAVTALVLGALALGGDGADASATPPAEKTRPSIVMTGEGTVTGVPDELGFDVRVSLTRTDVADAMDDASAAMKAVFEAVAKHGVTRRDMQTTGVSVAPSYDYTDGSRHLVGYRATQRARIEVADLHKAGTTLSAAAAAGGNDVRIGGVSLGISDRDGLLAKARRAAVADAKAKAAQYAGAGGQELGRVLSLKEVSAPAPRARDLAYASSARLDVPRSAVPVKAGSKDLKVRIRVVWELR